MAGVRIATDVAGAKARQSPISTRGGRIWTNRSGRFAITTRSAREAPGVLMRGLADHHRLLDADAEPGG
ncbi:MAG: hypothetical protein WBL61_01800, partial [Bryobacteraceae bacterium]